MSNKDISIEEMKVSWAKVNELPQDISSKLSRLIYEAQKIMEDGTKDVGPRDKVRKILLDDANFTIRELTMFAIFD